MNIGLIPTITQSILALSTDSFSSNLFGLHLPNLQSALFADMNVLVQAADVSAEQGEKNSFGLLAFLVILVLVVSGVCIFLVMKYKKMIASQTAYLNDQNALIAERDRQLGQYKEAYNKSIAQKKQMKSLFTEEFDKVVKKYKVLANAHATLKSQPPEPKEEISQELLEANKSLEETQALLIQSEKMSSLGQLTAGIAHEINNPVNFVANGINTLKENFVQLNVFIDNYKRICELDSIEEVKKYYKIQREDDHEFADLQTSTNESLDDVAYGTTRITEIVNGLRVFARQDESDILKADINQILENAIIILKPKYKKKAKILKNLDTNIQPIKCLPGQLNQALVNLIGNACDAIDFKGTINVKSEEFNADTLKLTITDNGKGMSDEVKKKIFDPFFTTKAVGKGTGLGLSITYGIIEKHNGKIEVESTEGKGTTFTIYLPKKLKKVNKPIDPARE